MSFSERGRREPFPSDPGLENRLRQVAGRLPYPPTPDLAASEGKRVRTRQSTAAPVRRSLAFALALLVLIAALVLASPARARVLEWIRVGAVKIFLIQPTPLPTLPAATPVPSPTPLVSALDLAGETSLARAQKSLGFQVRLPSTPEDLGPPDHVYQQETGGQAVVLVWTDPGQPGKVRLALTETNTKTFMFEKYNPKSVLDTRVGGQPAVWIDGEYLLVMRDGETTLTRLINQGHTLLWTAGEMTYRLETDMDLEAAVQTAELIR